jgi:hypothetical protein
MNCKATARNTTPFAVLPDKLNFLFVFT